MASDSSRPAVGGLPVDAEPAPDLVAEHHVLADRQVRAEVDLLVHDGDAGRLSIGRAVEPAVLTIDHDLAGIDRVHAGECLDQRRLPGAVLAHERMDLAREELEIDVVECLDAGEGDRDAMHLDDRCR